MDYVFLSVTLLLMISLFLSGRLIGTHPQFLIVSFILLGVALFLSGILSNTFNAVHNDTVVSEALTWFTITEQLINNFPMVLLAGGALFLIGMYSKDSFGSGYDV